MANISLIYVQSKVGLPVVNKTGVRPYMLLIYNIYILNPPRALCVDMADAGLQVESGRIHAIAAPSMGDRPMRLSSAAPWHFETGST
jgi:hypothetical protein